MESNFEWITANGDIGIRFFHSIDDGGYSNPPHWHNDLEIIYLLEGRLKVRFGDGGERQIGADELLVINSGTIHAVTAYPNQAIVLQVPYEMLLQYMEHYDQLYFVVDERPASEAEKQKLAEFKAVLREMDEVYGAQRAIRRCEGARSKGVRQILGRGSAAHPAPARRPLSLQEGGKANEQIDAGSDGRSEKS